MMIIFLATTLLSIAMSENSIMMEKYPGPTSWFHDKQFWNKKTKQASQNDISSELDQFSNYDNDKQLPQISDMRFISDSKKLPSITIIRRPKGQLPQIDLLSADKLKPDSAKSTVLISIGIQERKNADRDAQGECSKKNYHKHNQSWQLQQPFYVEEPRWIEIDSEYMDGTSRHPEGGDPYVLSRGKKIFRIKNPAEQLDKTIKDYEEFFDYPNRSERPSKSRSRRFVAIDEKVRMSNINDEKKNNQLTNPVHDVFVNKFDENKLDSLLVTMSPRERKFMKRNPTIANGVIITNSAEQEQRENIDKRFDNASKESKRLAIFKKRYEKRGNAEKAWKNYEEDLEKKEATALKQVKNNAQIGEMQDLNADDDFLSEKSFDDRKKETYGRKNTKDESIDEQQENSSIIKYYEKSENKDEVRASAKTTDTQLTNELHSKIPEIKNCPNYRKKRNAEPKALESEEYELLKNIEREILCSLYLKPRDKHGKVINPLIFSSDPYVIHRGKKASRELEDDFYSATKRRNEMDNVDGYRAKAIDLPLKSMDLWRILNVLSMEKSKCNDYNNNINTDRLSKSKPRDRRGSLDKILNLENLKYDPYYAVRGKRINLDNDRRTGDRRSQRGISFESERDAMRNNKF